MGEGICSRYDSKAALSIEAHFSMGACPGNQELLAELAEKLDTVFFQVAQLVSAVSR